jgi:hypothetical protein
LGGTRHLGVDVPISVRVGFEQDKEWIARRFGDGKESVALGPLREQTVERVGVLLFGDVALVQRIEQGVGEVVSCKAIVLWPSAM